MVKSLATALRSGEKGPFVHFSIDDCITGFEELFRQRPRSLWDSEFFGFLKKLHDATGVVVTCYCFFENRGVEGARWLFNLDGAGSEYREEFAGANEWLFFGLHALSRQTPMTSQITAGVNDLITTTRHALNRIAGQAVLPSCWRPHYFSADRDACDLMLSRGTEVLLTPEDDRKIVACLNPATVKHMQQGGWYDDRESGFLLVHSSFQVEDPKLGLVDQKTRIEQDLAHHDVSAFYTHEHQLIGPNAKEEVKRRLRELLTHAKNLGATFVV